MKRYLVSGLLVIGLVAGGLAPRASAQVEDAEVVVGNLPAAGSALVAGLQNALDVLTGTQSAVDTSAAVGNAFVGAGAVLVDGTDQFGGLALGFAFINLGVQQGLNPVLVLLDDQAPIFDALDDPSMLGDVFNADDIGTILSNSSGVLTAAWEGTPFAFGTGLQDALVQGLQGNLTGAGLFPEPSLVDSIAMAIVAVVNTLFDGTNYGSGGTNFAGTLGFTSLVVIGGAKPVLTELEVNVTEPLAEGGADATAPLIEFLEGLSL